jgi:3-hydroxybutyrate dehydrogenase
MTTSRALEGRVAVVTGSTQGLGLAIAQSLAEAGSHVVLHGLADEARMRDKCRDIERAHRVRATFSSADLRTRTGVEHLLATAAHELGHCDVLVNNAVVRHTGLVEDFSADAWEESMAVNLSAAFHAVSLAVPSMKQRRWGRIVNVSSIYGLIGAPGRVGYVTAKTALIGLTRAVALETMSHGITCNAVCPGTVDTPVHTATIAASAAAEGIPAEEAARRFLAGKQPTGRLIDPAGVAAFVTFLCSPAGADITGAALPVDGAWSVS